MKTKLFFSTVTILMLLSLFGSAVGVEDPKTVQAAVSLPIVAAQPGSIETSEEPVENEDGSPWFIEGQNSTWTAGERDQVEQVLANSFAALAKVGLDGETLLEGYRFRRFAGEYVDGAAGLIGVVDHHEQEIALSDTAFLRMGGFYIYHELGHAVDFRLDRRLSEEFHALAGSDSSRPENEWQTAEGFWLRQHGHEDREEATADAFALWSMREAGNPFKPVFPGTPVGTDYEAIGRLANEVLDWIVEPEEAG